MYSLSLIHETMLISPTPGPAFVLDELLAVPSRPRCLTPCNRSGRWHGVLITSNVIKRPSCRIAVLIPMGLFPVSNPALCRLEHHGRLTFCFAGTVSGRPAGCNRQGRRMVRRRMDRNTPFAPNILCFFKEPARRKRDHRNALLFTVLQYGSTGCCAMSRRYIIGMRLKPGLSTGRSHQRHLLCTKSRDCRIQRIHRVRIISGRSTSRRTRSYSPAAGKAPAWAPK